MKPGITVPGIVTNITNFGAFVDIGVKQDGLLHISQMSNTYISDPNQVVKLQQRVMVTVTEVDVSRKRISLSMKGNSSSNSRAGNSAANNTSNPSGSKSFSKPANKSSESLNPFQSKLMELKKKFKD